VTNGYNENHLLEHWGLQTAY